MGATEAVTALRLVPACEGTPVVQTAGEPIELDARDSRVEGVMLRYEPNPKKLCLGYWGNPGDVPIWEFTVTTPGTYEVILTQGCGKGAGGSEAVVECAEVELTFTVRDTGGYQNWVDRSLGRVTFQEAGRQSLRVRVLKKARGIMD
ncbi:MAG: N-acetylgalactosamine 6-sulfate sulfatase (GALNS), partial [Akkermansiaceae bacterium]|nr:N-acetylgalactosamine 6-sulfate sulfatase (GALNS) [Akkermansiaceae bacterium]